MDLYNWSPNKHVRMKWFLKQIYQKMQSSLALAYFTLIINMVILYFLLIYYPKVENEGFNVNSGPILELLASENWMMLIYSKS